MSAPRSPARWVAALAAVVVGVVGGGAALATARPEPGAFDECSFQAALSAWDLLAFEPHFPGYPLAVLGARLLAAAGAPAPYAAQVALLLPLAALALWRGAGGGVGGLLAAGAFALAPSLAGEAARPMADAVASAWLAVSLGLLAACARRPTSLDAALCGLTAGLAAGAKPDLLPWLALLVPLARCAPPGARLRLLLPAAALAALPLLAAALLAAQGAGGGGPLLHEARRFLGGHLFEWGGAVSAPAGHASRLGGLLPLGEATGAAAAARGVALLGLLALACRAPQRVRRGALLAGGPYLLWTVLGQNPDHARHALPLLPGLALLVGLGLGRLRARPALRLALGAALLLGALSGLAARVAARTRPRPVDTLCAWAGGLDRLSVRVYAGATGRVLRARVPGLDVRRTTDLLAIARDLQADPVPPPRVLILSEVAGADGLPLVVDPGSPGLAVHDRGPEGQAK